ncbi:MAG: hypothetical protein R3230_00310 [Nitrosopumilaceae archaeon]|nr:hypothetical protein [Nitrosopumilaceae archaeon]
MKEKYEYKGHGPWITLGGKQYCWGCGLVALNNQASDWCVDKGCLYNIHPQYKSSMKRLAGIKKFK